MGRESGGNEEMAELKRPTVGFRKRTHLSLDIAIGKNAPNSVSKKHYRNSLQIIVHIHTSSINYNIALN